MRLACQGTIGVANLQARLRLSLGQTRNNETSHGRAMASPEALDLT